METKLIAYLDIGTNRQNLFDFYNIVYPNSPWLLDNERFIWQNFSNPLQSKEENAIWLLYDENENLIGQNIFIFYNLSVGNKVYRGFCSTNLIVKPGIVGKGYGHAMISKNETFDGIAYAVGITPASIRAFVKRGWIYIADAKMMSRIINPFPNLKYLKMPLWKIILAYPIIKILNFITNISARLLAPKKIDGISYSKIVSFESSWDKIWDSYLKDFAIYFKRTSETLNYKYFKRKDANHNVLLFKKDEKPIGYAVYRLSVNEIRKIQLGRIVDIVYDPSLGLELLTYMIRVLKENLLHEKIDGIVAIAATDEIARAFRKNGLYLSRVQPAIIKEEDFSIEDLRGRFKNLWYITLGDSDLDNYW